MIRHDDRHRTGTAVGDGDVEGDVLLTMPSPADPRVRHARAVRIAIVEDDPVLQDCLRELLVGVEGFEVVGLASSVATGRVLLADEPDVLLLDLGLPDGTGLDLVAAARAMGGRTKVIVISVFGDVRSVVRAIEEGADGYLLKDADAAHVAEAIETVLAGGAPLSPAVAGHILARMRRGPEAVPTTAAEPAAATLTAKEMQVLELLAKGRSFKEVAIAHRISQHTVGDHVKSIYRKLSVNSRGEAVFKAVQSGLIRMEG